MSVSPTLTQSQGSLTIYAVFGDPSSNSKKRSNPAVGVPDSEPQPDSSCMTPKRVRLQPPPHSVANSNNQSRVPIADPHSHISNPQPVAHSTPSPVPILSGSQPLATPTQIRSSSGLFHTPPTFQWQPVNTQYPASPGCVVPSLNDTPTTPIARRSTQSESASPSLPFHLNAQSRRPLLNWPTILIQYTTHLAILSISQHFLGRLPFSRVIILSAPYPAFQIDYSSRIFTTKAPNFCM
ncbi:hypothetical protein NLI96_g4977 [Meripilus lineatus]|uniref:Uncharacterized protein n=1 Tax=Meripilus lineatus TaxID=2056292 RepID=A0AAD5YF72_9APHY|nr:hypothetical protein NLI96_g4977 [Physisporinus lineatus]